METLVKSLAVVVYIVVMLGIGWWSMRRTRNVGDFFIGGRTLGPWLSAMAYSTTYFSAVLFIGFAGKLGWAFGMHALWIALGNALIGVTFAWWLLAAKTRDMTERLSAITMPEFLETRYGLSWFRPMAAIVIFIFLVPYSASVYQGLGHLFEVNLGIDYITAVIFMAALTGIYLVMGGYFALAITDLVRGIMEFFGTIILILLIAQATGHGVFGAFAAAAASPDFTPGLIAKPGAMFPGWLALCGVVFMTSFGPMGLPQMVQKFYSIKSRDVIRRAMVVATVFALVISFGAYFTGGLSHNFFLPPPPAATAGVHAGTAPAPAPPTAGVAAGAIQKIPLPTTNGKPDFDKIVPEMLDKFTPPWFSIVIMLLVLSASMSALSSLVLVSSGAVAVDLLGAHDRRDKSSTRGLLLLRVLCGVFVAISVILAARRIEAIVTLMSMSWGALAGAFIGPFVWGVLWRRVTAAGAATGFVVGLAISVGGFFAFGPANAPVAASMAMLASLVLVPLVSLVTPPLPQAALAKAFGDPASGEPPAAPALSQEVRR